MLCWSARLRPARRRADDAEKYTLRYQFQPGEVLRWDVVHRGRVRTTYGGATKATETVSKSVKVWRVKEVDGDRSATFEQSVEDVDMWQKLTGRDEVRYNSRTDKTPPRGFEDAAKRVGVPLVRVSLDQPRKDPQTREPGLQSDHGQPGRTDHPLARADRSPSARPGRNSTK